MSTCKQDKARELTAYSASSLCASGYVRYPTIVIERFLACYRFVRSGLKKNIFASISRLQARSALLRRADRVRST